MEYSFEEREGLSDIIFTAEGESPEEVFIAAWDAAAASTVEDLETVDFSEVRDIVKEESDLEYLLFDFLNEFLFLRDTEGLILRIDTVTIDRSTGRCRLEAHARGETYDSDKHGRGSDIKAVTFHEFYLKEEPDGRWRARVLLDI
jgi:SHS2 domain-containing protein